MPKVSIIIPVYGVEAYLEKCVQSVTNQTLTDIEIILVDDGSKDNCPTLCDNFAKTDERICVIHKPNGGLSDARNVGLAHATSDYVMFVDSDDYVDKNMCEVLYDTLIKEEVDMVTSLAYEVKDEKMVNTILNFSTQILSSKQALNHLFSGNGITLYAVGKLYKKTLFDHILFPKGKLYEDAFTTPYLINKAHKIAMTSHHFYYYVRRNDSITLAKYSVRDLDCIEAHQKNRAYFKGQDEALDKALDFRYYWSLMYIYDKMVVNHATNTKEGKEVFQTIKKNFWAILRNPYLSKKRKLALLVMRVSQSLYLIVLKKTGG